MYPITNTIYKLFIFLLQLLGDTGRRPRDHKSSPNIPISASYSSNEYTTQQNTFSNAHLHRADTFTRDSPPPQQSNLARTNTFSAGTWLSECSNAVDYVRMYALLLYHGFICIASCCIWRVCGRCQTPSASVLPTISNLFIHSHQSNDSVVML